jgi:NADH dehydrogenase/putative oxidoreductase
MEPTDRFGVALLLLLLAARGAGTLSLDFTFDHWIERGLRTAPPQPDQVPHVVIVGGGFGGIAATRGLRWSPCRVTLIDQRNHYIFQPLLYQVATAALSPSDIAIPIRSMTRGQSNVRIRLGTVSGVDLAARDVLVDGDRVSFDYLVLATGAQHSYFGREDWGPHAPGLKTIEDATAIRSRLLRAFEQAEIAETEPERVAWITFVIVGGGPTGVELAGALAELARTGLDREYHAIDPTTARVILVQAGPRILPTFATHLSDRAQHSLSDLGVEVRINARVQVIDEYGVEIDGQRVEARTTLWAAGVAASPAARWLQRTTDSSGRLVVGDDLSVSGLSGVFAIGDTAASNGWKGRAVPGLAPAAKQQGRYVAHFIHAAVAGLPRPAAFRYRHYGSLATIGRLAAVAELGRVYLWGAPAWWFWGAAHVAFLVGGRNRASVVLNWVWAYLTYRRSTRLITGTSSLGGNVRRNGG